MAEMQMRDVVFVQKHFVTGRVSERHVGKDGVEKIIFSDMRGPGDLPFCDIHFKDGGLERLYAPEVIRFGKDKKIIAPKAGLITA